MNIPVATEAFAKGMRQIDLFRLCDLRLALVILTVKQDRKAGARSRPGTDSRTATVITSIGHRRFRRCLPAPTWHTRALESVPLSGIVRRRDSIHAGHDSDRR